MTPAEREIALHAKLLRCERFVRGCVLMPLNADLANKLLTPIDIDILARLNDKAKMAREEYQPYNLR